MVIFSFPIDAVMVTSSFSGPPMLLNRNLLYTAVTRAKELCVVVGKEEVLYSMVDNIREAARNSALDTKIKSLYNFILSDEGQLTLDEKGQVLGEEEQISSEEGQISSEEGQISKVGERADDF